GRPRRSRQPRNGRAREVPAAGPVSARRLVSSFATVDEAIEEIRAGRMLVVVDDEDRENEGDLVMAADRVTAEQVNLMPKHRCARCRAACCGARGIPRPPSTWPGWPAVALPASFARS